MQLPNMKRIAVIGLFLALALLITVVVFEGWTVTSAVFQNLFLIIIGLVFIGAVIYTLWHLLMRVEERPTVAWRVKLENSARVSVPNVIYGHRLWVQGDQRHSPHPVGRIVGWTSLKHEFRVPVKREGKVQLDSNKMPKMKPLRHEKDEYEVRRQPDGAESKVIIHRKGEIKTWNESIFQVNTGGILSKNLLYRIPERMHSDLSGDVFSSCISFVPKGDFMFPNTVYDQPLVEIMLRDEIRLESFYGLLDDIKLGVKKGMDSNPQHRIQMEQKKLLEVPAE